MTTLKKRMLIATAALTILTAGAAWGNTSSAAWQDDDNRDYHIALVNAEHEYPDQQRGIHGIRKGHPAPPPEYKGDKKDHEKWEKKDNKDQQKWEKKHKKHKDGEFKGEHRGPRHGDQNGRHLPPPPPEKR